MVWVGTGDISAATCADGAKPEASAGSSSSEGLVEMVGPRLPSTGACQSCAS